VSYLASTWSYVTSCTDKNKQEILHSRCKISCKGCWKQIDLETVVLYSYKINPYCDTLVSFTHIILILRSDPTYDTNPPAASQLAQKLANYGSRRLLPLALPMGWRRPNQVHRLHPHIMGNDACAWFGRSTHWGQDIRTD
jgi:hypothetical protein